MCFEVFGTRDDEQSPSFRHVLSNETIRNYAVICFLWYCIVSMSCVNQQNILLKCKCLISDENMKVFYLVFH